MATAEGLLEALQNGEIQDSEKFCQDRGWPHDQTFVGVLRSLESRNMIAISSEEREVWVLKDEGKSIVESGASYEARCFNCIPDDGVGLSFQELKDKLPDETCWKIGFGVCKQSKWLAMDGKTKKITRMVKIIEDATFKTLVDVKNGKIPSKQDAQSLSKRNLIKPEKLKTFKITKGPEYALSIKKQHTQLTAEMLQGDGWKSESFKKINLNSMGIPPAMGALHPLMKVRSQFREIFLEMGFEEMPTNRYIESSFWNFDTLFQPQQHPARDAHDTFFIKEPATAPKLGSEEYVQKVKSMHEVGDEESFGWRYDWKEEEARKNIMRTHTTAVSSRMLYKLAQDGFKPAKYFSIDRVFRNENLDATHLAEFHQIEGLIADYNLTWGHLIGVLRLFFSKLGMTNLRFKPAYNPYTEPSMEVFGYHEDLGRWIEIGNSGIFRPEMLRPMGLPEGVSVIAWGLSLERPTMIQCKMSNIRDLCGHKVDLEFVKSNPLCRLDKF